MTFAEEIRARFQSKTAIFDVELQRRAKENAEKTMREINETLARITEKAIKQAFDRFLTERPDTHCHYDSPEVIFTIARCAGYNLIDTIKELPTYKNLEHSCESLDLKMSCDSQDDDEDEYGTECGKSYRITIKAPGTN